MAKPSIQELTRQLLIQGTSCITDATGNTGYKTEVVIAGALLRIADVLESQTEILQTTTRARFTDEERQDGMNHYRATHVKGTNVVQIDFLGTSPKMAETLVFGMAEVLKAAIATAKQQEGGADNG